MATEFQNALFDTMIQFANHSNEVSKAAETIECKIISCTNEELGEYSANYLGNIITVYSNNHEKYEADEDVYVLVPEGDFNKTKTIIGRVVPKGAIPGDDSESSDGKKIYDVADIPIDINAAELISFKNNSNTVNIFNNDETKKSGLSIIKKYLEEGKRTFRLYTDAKAEFDKSGQDYNGHYGFTLIIPTVSDKGEPMTTEFTFDSTQMIGNANGFYNWSRNQYLDFKILSDVVITDETDIQIKFYCDNYRLDENIETPDIFFENLRLALTAELPEANQNGYQLVVLPSETNYFTLRTSDKKTLTPYLRVGGRDVDLNSLKYVYWFVEDRSIISEFMDGFNGYGGLGWRMLDLEPHTTWVVSKNDIPSSIIYKCVVVYNEMPIAATIELNNLFSSSFVIVRAKNITGIYPKDSEVEVEIISYAEGITDSNKPVSYYPMRINKQGNYLDVPEISGTDEAYTLTIGEVEYKCYYRSIKLSSNLIDNFNTICCTVKDENNVIIGSGNVIINIGTPESENDSPYTIVVTGTPMNHQYDSFGNSPLVKNGVSGTYINKIEPLECKVFENGIELDKNEFGYYSNAEFTWLVPDNSLFRISGYNNFKGPNAEGYFEYYTGTNNTFTYSLEDKFNDTKANKRMFVVVKVGEETIKLPINVFCTQTGRAGSNGTGYTAMLTWDGYPYRSLNSEGLEQKLKFWYNKSKAKDNFYYYSYKTNNWEIAGEAILKDVLKLYVYQNGAEVLEPSRYSVNYSMFQSADMFDIEDVSADGRLVTLSFDGNSIRDGFNVVQAKITINDTTITNKVIYCYYPLEITIAEGDSEAKKISVNNGYSEVMYGSDGVDPYYNEEYFVAEYEGDETLDWEATENFEIKNANVEIEDEEDKNNIMLINPVTTFDQRVSKNYVKVSVGNLTYVRPIIVYCNRYGRSAIDGYDGVSIDINQDDKHIYAPQIGALRQDTLGKTGVIMGKIQEDGESAEDGLIGLNNGIETFRLDAKDGSAYFGPSGSGQIRFIPGNNPKAYIAGWTINEKSLSSENENVYICSGNHTDFDSVDTGFYLGPKGLSLGANFWVDRQGNAHGVNFEATGYIALKSYNSNEGDSFDGEFSLGKFTQEIYDGYHETIREGIVFDKNVKSKHTFRGAIFKSINWTSKPDKRAWIGDMSKVEKKIFEDQETIKKDDVSDLNPEQRDDEDTSLNDFYNHDFDIKQNMCSDSPYGFKFNSNVIIHDNLFINQGELFVNGNQFLSGTLRAHRIKANNLVWKGYTHKYFEKGYPLYNHIMERANEHHGIEANPDNIFMGLLARGRKTASGMLYPLNSFWQDNLYSNGVDENGNLKEPTTDRYYTSLVIPSLRWVMDFVRKYVDTYIEDNITDISGVNAKKVSDNITPVSITKQMSVPNIKDSVKTELKDTIPGEGISQSISNIGITGLMGVPNIIDSISFYSPIVQDIINVEDKNKMQYNKSYVEDDIQFVLNKNYSLSGHNNILIDRGNATSLVIDSSQISRFDNIVIEPFLESIVIPYDKIIAKRISSTHFVKTINNQITLQQNYNEIISGIDIEIDSGALQEFNLDFDNFEYIDNISYIQNEFNNKKEE